MPAGNGWAIVDTGLFTSATREIWKSVFDRVLGNAPITRILVTHLHPDHVGCAGWLANWATASMFIPLCCGSLCAAGATQCW